MEVKSVHANRQKLYVKNRNHTSECSSHVEYKGNWLSLQNGRLCPSEKKVYGISLRMVPLNISGVSGYV